MLSPSATHCSFRSDLAVLCPRRQGSGPPNYWRMGVYRNHANSERAAIFAHAEQQQLDQCRYKSSARHHSRQRSIFRSGRPDSRFVVQSGCVSNSGALHVRQRWPEFTAGPGFLYGGLGAAQGVFRWRESGSDTALGGLQCFQYDQLKPAERRCRRWCWQRRTNHRVCSVQ